MAYHKVLLVKGLLLFTLYSSKLFEVIKPHLPEAHAYADDSQLYLSFKPNNKENESEAVKSMELVPERLEHGCGWTNLNLKMIRLNL